MKKAETKKLQKEEVKTQNCFMCVTRTRNQTTKL